METALAVALVGLIGTLVGALFTYWSTKRREREAEWRKEKLVHYKVFVESLRAILRGQARISSESGVAESKVPSRIKGSRLEIISAGICL